MGSAFSIVIPDDEQTRETGDEFYRYHVENSAHDSSLADVFEYEQFQKRLEQEDYFTIFKKPPSAIVDAGEPTPADIVLGYEDEDGVVRDPEGLEAFVESLVAARKNLKRDGELTDGRDRTIEMCINILKFAKENEYGVTF